MPDSGTIVGLDADNDKISRIGDCIKSIPGFVAGEWEGDRWVFDVGTGNVAFRGYLSRAGGVILAIGGTADPDRTEKMIEFIRLRLGADADILTVDGSLVPELPMERVPINEKAGHQEDNLMKAMEALAINRVVYRRGNAITIPDTSITVKTRHGPRKQIGLATVTRAILMARLERCCLFHTIQNIMKRPTLVPAYPSARIVNQILEYAGEGASGIQPITGVMAAPFLRPDGTVCDRPGYDEATGVFYDPCGTVFPPMPEITPENAKRIATEALNRLARPVREFRFDTSEEIAGEWALTQDRDRVATISMFMAILAVHAVRTSPGYLIEAPTFGSGKTLAAELPPMMLIGDDPALVNGTDMSTDTFSNDFDTALLAGRGYVVIDNVKGKISGGKLLAMLTSKKISVRLYHTQRHVEVGDGMLLIITANNAEIDAEMARRLVRSRIDTGSERPNRIVHTFDPRDEVIRDRDQMVIDVLTVMHAYVVAGRPKQAGVSMGSFEDWASAVRDPLMWLGLPDIAASTDDALDGDPDTEKLDDMIAAWKDWKLTGGSYTTSQIVELATEREREPPDGSAPAQEDWKRPKNWEGPPPFRRRSLREACLAVAEKPGARGVISKERVGRWLANNKGKRRGNFRFNRRLADGRSEYQLVAAEWPTEAEQDLFRQD